MLSMLIAVPASAQWSRESIALVLAMFLLSALSAFMSQDIKEDA